MTIPPVRAKTSCFHPSKVNNNTRSLFNWRLNTAIRYLPFQRALSIVLNSNTANHSLFFLRVRTSVASGAWFPAKEPATQVKNVKANHENMISSGSNISLADILALGSRASWRASCGSLSENIAVDVNAENAWWAQRGKCNHNNIRDIYYYYL
jgi:hypothetical protein